MRPFITLDPDYHCSNVKVWRTYRASPLVWTLIITVCSVLLHCCVFCNGKQVLKNVRPLACGGSNGILRGKFLTQCCTWGLQTEVLTEGPPVQKSLVSKLEPGLSNSAVFSAGIPNLDFVFVWSTGSKS